MISKSTALAALALMLASPAEARCHAIWRYPWPQHCGIVRVALVEHRAPPPARVDLPMVAPAAAVAPVPLDERGQALELLKHAMTVEDAYRRTLESKP